VKTEKRINEIIPEVMYDLAEKSGRLQESEDSPFYLDEQGIKRWDRRKPKKANP